MPTVHWIALGTAHAIPDEHNANTHFLCIDGEYSVLVDCPDVGIVRLQRAGVRPTDLSALVVTHFHPDHVGGVPLLLMNLWLMGRRAPLTVYGLDHTLSRLEQVMEFYGWPQWPNFYPLHFHRISGEHTAPFLETPNTRWFAREVQHMIPAIGLRVEMPTLGKVLAYSADTAPCPATVALAQDADALFHEATGEAPGHSSAAQAATIATEARARALYLVHTDPARRPQLQAEAQQHFSGPVQVIQDGFTLTFTG